MTRLTLCLALAVLPAVAARAQDAPDQKVVFQKLQAATSFDRLSAAIPTNTDEDNARFVKLWDRMTDATSELRKAAEDRPVPAGFRRSLMDNVEVLDKVKTDDLTLARKLELCSRVASDLEVKAKYAASRVQKMRGPFDPVKVTARTKDGAQEVSGLEVWYAATIWTNGRKRSFKGLSSPTTEPLQPGEYMFWAQRGTAEGSRRTILIGDTGEDTEAVELTVPAKPNP